MTVSAKKFDFWEEELAWITEDIYDLLNRDSTANEDQKAEDRSTIALIAPKHKHLELVAASLHQRGLPVLYQRSENILEQEHILWIVNILKFAHLYSQGLREDAMPLLPQILSYPFWGLSELVIADISNQSYKKNKDAWAELRVRIKEAEEQGASKEELQKILNNNLAKMPDYANWLQIMSNYKPAEVLEAQLDEMEINKVKSIALFLENFSLKSDGLTLGQMLDWLLGVDQIGAYSSKYIAKEFNTEEGGEPGED